MESADQRVQSGIYKGEHGHPYLSRGIKTAEAYWNNEKLNGEENTRTFDTLLTDSLQIAEKKEEHEIVVLDIGCGYGNVFRDFLNDPDQAPKAKAFLKEHKDMKLRMVGLTDASTASDHLVRTQLEHNLSSQGINDNQVESYIARYSLTAAQRLSEFLKSQNIEKINVAVATWSFPYLGPNTFDGVLRDIIDYLAPEGKFVATPYWNYAPGFVRYFFYSLNVSRKYREGDPSFQKMLGTEGSHLTFGENVNIAEESKALAKVADKFIELGVLTQDEIDKKLGRYLPRWKKILNSLNRNNPSINDILTGDPKTDQARLGTLSAAFVLFPKEKLYDKVLTTMKTIKKEKLAKIKEDYAEKAEVLYGDKVIEITKK